MSSTLKYDDFTYEIILVKSKRPTTKDVAERANVSQMTVSRVLREKGYVSQEISEKVLKAANEIGYIRNNLAGSFSGQSTNLIGVIVPSLANSVFTDVLAGFDDAIQSSHLQAAISVCNYDQTREYKLVQDMLAWRPAGIVLTGIEHDKRTRSLLIQNNINTIEIMDVDGDPISKCIGISHRAAAQEMANHLIAKGHKRFGFIGCALNTDLRGKKRKDAFEATLAENGFALERIVISDEPSSSMMLGRELTAEILQDNNEPIAIYYSNDDLASGGLLQCLSQGLSVPHDVAIASFNGLDFLEAMPLQITTTKSPRFEIGQLAGRYMLGEQLDDVAHLNSELIVGETT